MTLTVPVQMYDSATPARIPLTPPPSVVAGYCDGHYAWTPEDWARFPDAEKVIITVAGSLKGNVADVETGDLTPQDGRGWIIAKQSHAAAEGRLAVATLYYSWGNREAVWSACEGLAYYSWIADWAGGATPPPFPGELPNSVARQYWNAPSQAYDLSMIYSQEWLDAINAVNRPWPLA